MLDGVQTQVLIDVGQFALSALVAFCVVLIYAELRRRRRLGR